MTASSWIMAEAFKRPNGFQDESVISKVSNSRGLGWKGFHRKNQSSPQQVLPNNFDRKMLSTEAKKSFLQFCVSKFAKKNLSPITASIHGK